MYRHAPPSWLRTMWTGLWFTLCRALYGLLGRWTLWLTERPEFSHVQPHLVLGWYAYLRKVQFRRLYLIARVMDVSMLVQLVAGAYVFGSATQQSRNQWDVSFLVFYFALFVLQMTLVVAIFGRIRWALLSFASTYSYGKPHRMLFCQKCGHDQEKTTRDDCSECGESLRLDEIIRESN